MKCEEICAFIGNRSICIRHAIFYPVITPVFRRDVHCFGVDSCYPLAFGVPALIMVLAVGNMTPYFNDILLKYDNDYIHI
jgi:hypothetical protein